MLSVEARKKDLETIVVIAAGFLLLYLLFEAISLLYIALLVLIISIISHRLAHLLSKSWDKLAHYLGLVNSKIILSIIFFLVVFPVAWLRRLFHAKGEEKEKFSNYYIRDYIYTADDFKKLW